eukprot:449388-Rhodomonas_salina.2
MSGVLPLAAQASKRRAARALAEFAICKANPIALGSQAFLAEFTSSCQGMYVPQYEGRIEKSWYKAPQLGRCKLIGRGTNKDVTTEKLEKRGNRLWAVSSVTNHPGSPYSGTLRYFFSDGEGDDYAGTTELQCRLHALAIAAGVCGMREEACCHEAMHALSLHILCPLPDSVPPRPSARLPSVPPSVQPFILSHSADHTETEIKTQRHRDTETPKFREKDREMCQANFQSFCL